MRFESFSFYYAHDFTAEGTRHSISLQRLGIESIDMVFIHDISPDTGDSAVERDVLYKIC